MAAGAARGARGLWPSREALVSTRDALARAFRRFGGVGGRTDLPVKCPCSLSACPLRPGRVSLPASPPPWSLRSSSTSRRRRFSAVVASATHPLPASSTPAMCAAARRRAARVAGRLRHRRRSGASRGGRQARRQVRCAGPDQGRRPVARAPAQRRTHRRRGAFSLCRHATSSASAARATAVGWRAAARAAWCRFRRSDPRFVKPPLTRTRRRWRC